MHTLPTCITARRIGHPSMGVESEYDAMGEQAPVTWTCNCGAQLAMEHYDYEREVYLATPRRTKDEFLAEHTTCTATCFSCGKAPVERQGYWCQPCEDKADMR